MLDAIAVAVAEKGYAATTVGDVVSGAGVSRKTFYEHFADKEECSWPPGTPVCRWYSTRSTSNEQAADPIGRMRSGLRAYLETLAAEPAFARSFFIEVVAAARTPRRGVPRCTPGSPTCLRRCTTRHGGRCRSSPTSAAHPARGGRRDQRARLRLRARRPHRAAAELEETILYLELVLFAGHDVAAQATGL